MAITTATNMRTIKKLRSEPGLWLTDEVPVPEFGPNDVLIEITHAGICGTDRHIYEWDQWSQKRIAVGITTGHEFVGRIVAIGDECNKVKIGDRVSGEGHIFCGSCRPCRTGNAHICEECQIIGIDRDGCFARYMSFPEKNVWPVHPDIPDKVAAIFDPLGNAVHTVMTAGVSGKNVLITGVGIIGLMAVSVARAAGASKIFATDVDEKRLGVAKQIGADYVFDARTEWIDVIRDLTDGLGPDVLLEMSGNPHAIRQGFTALSGGGTAALLGIPGKPMEIDLSSHIIFKSATVHGIIGRRIFETWYQMEALLLSGRLQLDPIITHVIDMDQFEEGIRMMQTGEAIKVVLNIGN
ncbi:MAG: L-threonine 3-dehydrogenase [Pirellulaceae bacterium]